LRRLDREEFLKWRERYEVARNLLEGKIEKMEELQEEIEVKLHVIGATAIEDKLQDQVPETIHQLKKAGIKVWVLTGDKIETAKTIGYSCELLSEDMKLLEFVSHDAEELDLAMEEAIRLMAKEEAAHKLTPRGTVVSGDALIKIMEDEFLQQKLNFIASKCSAVLCCRVSPKQKQEIVKLVKKSLPHLKTLAIGDGANDVNMITEAHIGVGIKGVEGQQAARSSDFAIAEFKHLRRLVFVYGREAYRKNSTMVLYCFFKNILLVMPQFWYAMVFVNSSGVIIYNEILYQFVNIIYTSVPIVCYAVLDRDCSYDTLEYSHQYYYPGPKKLFFNSMVFWQWVMFAAIEGLMIVLFW